MAARRYLLRYSPAAATIVSSLRRLSGRLSLVDRGRKNDPPLTIDFHDVAFDFAARGDVCKCRTSQPERFELNPLQKMPGLNN
jgi:hypothetical protein